jgi:hypothetical protein
MEGEVASSVWLEQVKERIAADERRASLQTQVAWPDYYPDLNFITPLFFAQKLSILSTIWHKLRNGNLR